MLLFFFVWVVWLFALHSLQPELDASWLDLFFCMNILFSCLMVAVLKDRMEDLFGVFLVLNTYIYIFFLKAPDQILLFNRTRTNIKCTRVVWWMFVKSLHRSGRACYNNLCRYLISIDIIISINVSFHDQSSIRLCYQYHLPLCVVPNSRGEGGNSSSNSIVQCLQTFSPFP